MGGGSHPAQPQDRPGPTRDRRVSRGTSRPSLAKRRRMSIGPDHSRPNRHLGSVVLGATEHPKSGDQLRGACDRAAIRGVRHHPHEPVLRQWTGRPAWLRLSANSRAPDHGGCGRGPLLAAKCRLAHRPGRGLAGRASARARRSTAQGWNRRVEWVGGFSRQAWCGVRPGAAADT